MIGVITYDIYNPFTGKFQPVMGCYTVEGVPADVFNGIHKALQKISFSPKDELINKPIHLEDNLILAEKTIISKHGILQTGITISLYYLQEENIDVRNKLTVFSTADRLPTYEIYEIYDSNLSPFVSVKMGFKPKQIFLSKKQKTNLFEEKYLYKYRLYNEVYYLEEKTGTGVPEKI